LAQLVIWIFAPSTGGGLGAEDRPLTGGEKRGRVGLDPNAVIGAGLLLLLLQLAQFGPNASAPLCVMHLLRLDVGHLLAKSLTPGRHFLIDLTELVGRFDRVVEVGRRRARAGRLVLLQN